MKNVYENKKGFRLGRLSAAFITALVIVLAGSFASFASTVSSCYWDDGNGGIKAAWDESDEESDFYVQLYKGSMAYGGNKLTTPIKVKKNHFTYDFTNLINNNGCGTYYFKVWKTSENESAACESDAYQVTENELVLYNPHNRGWQFIEGSWYLYSETGEILTGWQYVNDKWYYMDPAGRCLLNTTTPDGYTVDATGAWVP